ncbi:LacI family DNA-binding transcriptional regulator [uncultured Maritimibacter sp.]|jgi:LacI family transcriptional regulator|uniref:LacI family DNA-binding transcriptional regulator n=1 Tax=uncultured Maritimibacter sp. TaxID=991866 RepID=UPI000A8C4C99|nr:LacI family DNA-binding transcriptional regulator [uncultured Maritimibacter sp.]
MDDEAPATKAKSRVTLHDVAAASGVSKSTVSRLLDDRLTRPDTPKAQHVRRIAQELGYVRDLSAANLRRGSTGMIGVIVPRLTDTVMAMYYEALARAAAPLGKFTIVANTDDSPEASLRAADALIQRGVDGLILTTARTGNAVLSDALEARGVPFVFGLREDGLAPAVVSDDVLGGYLATRHLIDLGHERIAMICGPDYATSSLNRVAGFRQAMAEAGLAIDDHLMAQSTFSIESGETAAEALLARPDRPTAIFAMNDNTAIGAMSVILRAGLSVPDDISLVGYNDIPIVSRLPVPLTTVRVPFDRLASLTVAALDEPTGPNRPRVAKVEPTMIPRKSSARRGR